MNLKSVETFVWSVRLGSFSAAARKLQSTQPAISMRIRELEKSLGVELFDRRKKNIQLTRKGIQFFEYAVKIVSLSTEAQVNLNDRSGLSGRLRMGVTETVALTWLPDFVATVGERLPDVVIELDIGSTSRVWNGLWFGGLELAVLPGPVQGPSVMAWPLGSVPYTWMSSPKLLRGQPTRTPKDLSALPVITLARESILHQISETWFRDGGAEPRQVALCNSLGVVAKMTCAGLGISLLPPLMFERELRMGELVVLDIDPPLQPLEFVIAHCSRPTAILERMVAQVAQETSTFIRAAAAPPGAGRAEIVEKVA